MAISTACVSICHTNIKYKNNVEMYNYWKDYYLWVLSWWSPTGLTHLGTGGDRITCKHPGKPKNVTKKLHSSDTMPVFITTNSSNSHSCIINLSNTQQGNL